MRPPSFDRFAALLGAALLSASCALPASAQELNLDPKALDAGAAKPAKSRKGATKPAAAAAAAKPQNGKTPDRQFGELEGWSPGKAPPGAKEEETAAPAKPAGGLGMSPTGNMAVGLPF